MKVTSKSGVYGLNVTRAFYGSDYPACIIGALAKVYKVSQTGELTDASGDAPEMLLPYKYWIGTSETEYNQAPYTITISKA
jgi:hypothetical protein